MKIQKLTLLIALTILASPHMASAQVTYTVTDLGTLGGTFVQPNTLNNRGQVVGGSLTPNDATFHGFFWQDGEMTDLGTIGGLSSISIAAGINDSGDVVVGSDTSMPAALANTFCGDQTTICRMFIWNQGIKVPDLGTFPGGTDAGVYTPMGFGFATSLINNNHQAAGTGDLPIVDPNNSPFSIFHAFRWDKGVITDIGTLGGNNSQAVGINDPGEVIGTAEIMTVPDPDLGFVPSHGFVWRDGDISDVGTLGGRLSWAGGINNRGQIVGASTLFPDEPTNFNVHGFLWDAGRLTDLPPFDGDLQSAASGINNHGQVVGTSFTVESFRAMLWDNGTAIDLNTRIPVDSGWRLVWAGSINARGQITGRGLLNDEIRAFLLTPVHGKRDSPKQSDIIH